MSYSILVHPIIPVESLNHVSDTFLEYVCYQSVNNNNIYDMLLTISLSESAYLITPEYTVETTFLAEFWSFLRLVVNNNKYFHILLTISYSESAYPITPVQSLKRRFWDIAEICLLFNRKEQQIFITCCWQYHIRNQRTRVPQ